MLVEHRHTAAVVDAIVIKQNKTKQYVTNEWTLAASINTLAHNDGWN